MIFDGEKERRALDELFDYVIVGSGAAGATAARVLVDTGARVAVVEEGPAVATAEFRDQLFPAFRRMFRGMGTQIAHGRAEIPVIQGSCLGGSTQVPQTIFCATTRKKQPIQFRGQTYRYVLLKPSKFFGYQRSAAGVGAVGRAGVDLGAEVFHNDAAVGLLAVADFDLVDFQVNVEEAARHGQRAAPLPGASLGGQGLGAGFLVVEGYAIYRAD